MSAWYAGSVRVVSVEPEGCPALHAALRAGKPVEAPVGGLAADSLGARQIGELMFPIAQAWLPPRFWCQTQRSPRLSN